MTRTEKLQNLQDALVRIQAYDWHADKKGRALARIKRAIQELEVA